MGLQQQNIKGVADIVLCIDCTGSMEPCIDAVKDQLNNFISTLENPPDQQQPVDWRLKMLGFRDLKCDREPWINRDEPLVDTADAARSQLARLRADGGGDEAESALDALWWAACKTDWRSPCTKIVVLLSDATSHDTLHASTVAEGAVGDDVSTVAQAISMNSIYLYAWAMQCPAWDTLKKLPRVEFTAVEGGGDGLKTLDFSKLMQTLGKTVSEVAARIGGATMPA